ncbi:phytanoyl-CoA dioxygenase, peroxisomal-like isoform X2 [Prorops nasuta]|uniref:phytanoyl-CoA dioxygenase, peroxisomal-like isoform X2 n=1 Tax=Prorops nasuta TaxID=863751 RepID=UPI0034CF099E
MSTKGVLRYTLEKNVLSADQRIFYENNGYIVFPKLIPEDILEKSSKRYDDIVAGKAPREGMIVMRDVKDRKTVNKIQDINFDPIFRQYTEYDKLLDIVECITGPNIMAIHSMLIAKPPDAGFGTSVHPPHQDYYYFPLSPVDRIVASWTAIERCDNENGCLHVIPGSHKWEKLFPHDYPPGTQSNSFNKYYHGIFNLPENVKWINLEMNTGDTVFFHPLLVHGSGVNRSNRTRKAISCHYASADCNYIEGDEVQRKVQEEILNHLKRTMPDVEINYSDIWRYKSSLVRGIRSNL